MGRLRLVAGALSAALACAIAVFSQTAGTGRAVLYEGARLILGDERPPIENGAFVVQNGRISAIGPKGAVTAPSPSARVDLTGKTVMPALINAHVHIGYEGYTSWGAGELHGAERSRSPSARGLLRRGRDAERSAAARPRPRLQFLRDQQAGKFPPASRFFFMPGMAPPNGGPDAILIKGTKVLKAVHEVSTAAEARAAVRGMAERQLKSVKIWVDDRRGTYPKMPPEVYDAIIDEAHTPRDARPRARHPDGGSEGRGSRRRRRSRAHGRRPRRWTTSCSRSFARRSRTGRRSSDSAIAARRAITTRSSISRTRQRALERRSTRRAAVRGRRRRPTREEMLANNLPKMIAAGARLVLGTDAGIDARHAFGWADHHEMARWVRARVDARCRRSSPRRRGRPRCSGSRTWGRSPSARAPTSSCSTRTRSRTSATRVRSPASSSTARL